ncbi:OTU domain-containing protein 5-like isoform X2 [Nilaparvata lugens]|uniref:OTU domain-containing protein 5-like isoform X2 n=1 Tax=Nilaparvata lugens TaxID=108931 RepID=UPI00193D8602|nr:OTU domain-containing protein 5-like isoform X2 [Nilaparvata lugens]
MTILSKKRTLQVKSDIENSESQTHHGNTNQTQPHGISIGLLTNQINERQQDRLSTAQWTREQEAHLDDYNSQNSCGPGRSRKRHRISSHQADRNCKIRDRSATSSLQAASTDDQEAAGCSGYNSGDEYSASASRMQLSEIDRLEKRRAFEKKLRKLGWQIKHMDEDGACLFRAIADQVYGDQEMHDVVRQNCMDYIASNRDYFSQYVTEDFNHYLDRKRLVTTHGNHIEVQAMSEMYNRKIEVYCFEEEPINTFQGKEENDNEPIRLSYETGHYDSIVDPQKATIGVGLGLPNFTPGAAEKNLITDAVRQSEELDIEKTMLDDKLRATDWEATNEAIEEQVARQSYVQWLKDNERLSKAAAPTATATASSSAATGSPTTPSSPTTPLILNKQETAPSLDMLPPQFVGLDGWEDAGILAEVLAASQQEYLDNLKKAYTNELPDGKKQDDCM